MSVVLRDYIPNSEPKTTGGCYFPAEYQGEFVMQVSAGGMVYEPIQYSTINITFNAIPVWGYCHQRIGDNVLLMDRSVNSTNCVHFLYRRTRRFHLVNLISDYYKIRICESDFSTTGFVIKYKNQHNEIVFFELIFLEKKIY